MPQNSVPLPGSANPPAQPLIQGGDMGDAVRTVQQRLGFFGFYRGAVDGQFGPGTQQAVANFQQSRGLPPTGAVDNMTLRALGYEVDNAPAAPMMGINMNTVLRMFPDTARGSIQSYLPLVLRALAQYGLGDKTMTMMALATIRAESAGFAPISEYQSQYNTAPGGAPYALYDFRTDIGNNAKGDGARFKGRGFIQLTGRSNYEKYSQMLGMGNRLVEQPDLANDPNIAAQLLACFLKQKEGVIRQALARNDYATARKAVNGGSHGLDAFTMAYNTGIQSSLA